MSEYKRLTSYMQIGNNIVAIQPQRKERIQAYIDRLFELEDKIENGTLVELPCKVGDDVYYIKDYGFGRKRAERMHVVGFNFGNGNKEIKVVGSYGEQAWGIYTTKEAAEAKLKELQEGKE